MPAQGSTATQNKYRSRNTKTILALKIPGRTKPKDRQRNTLWTFNTFKTAFLLYVSSSLTTNFVFLFLLLQWQLLLTSFFCIWIKILKFLVVLKKRPFFRRFRKLTPRPLAPYIVLDGGGVDKNTLKLMHCKGFLGYIQIAFTAVYEA